MQRHGTLAYIESTITGNLDKQQQSMATNQAPVIWREDGKQSTSTSIWHKRQKRQTKNQYLAQSCMHTNTFTGTLLANVSTVNQ